MQLNTLIRIKFFGIRRGTLRSARCIRQPYFSGHQGRRKPDSEEPLSRLRRCRRGRPPQGGDPRPPTPPSRPLPTRPAPARAISPPPSASPPSRPAGASTAPPSPNSSTRSTRPAARTASPTSSASSPAPRCSSSTYVKRPVMWSWGARQAVSCGERPIRLHITGGYSRRNHAVTSVRSGASWPPFGGASASGNTCDSAARFKSMSTRA